MPVILTVQARTRDWGRLQALCRETLVPRAKEVGADRFQLYRNAHDATELLIVIEVSGRDGASEMDWVLSDRLAGLLAGGETDSCFWEPCG